MVLPDQVVSLSRSSGNFVKVFGLSSDFKLNVLQQCFFRCGKVAGVEKCKDDDSFFVYFMKSHAVNLAIQRMNGAVILGRSITVTAEAQNITNSTNNSTSTSTSGSTNNSWTCRAFLAGKCTKGDRCPYIHNVEKLTGPQVLPATDKADVVTTSLQVCRNYITFGKCVDESQCPYSHPKIGGDYTPAAAEPVPAPVKASPVPVKSTPEPVVAPVVAPVKATAQGPKMCAECDKNVAELKCNDCDEYFCKPCDTVAHASRVMSKHTRVPLQKMCDNCSKNAVRFECLECSASLCKECNRKIHFYNLFRSHTRRDLKSDTATNVVETKKPVIEKKPKAVVIEQKIPEPVVVQQKPVVLEKKPVVLEKKVEKPKVVVPPSKATEKPLSKREQREKRAKEKAAEAAKAKAATPSSTKIYFDDVISPNTSVPSTSFDNHSSSSDDDYSDVRATTSTTIAKTKPSYDSDTSEDIPISKIKQNVVTAAAAAVVSKKADTSSEDSSSSSSDDDDDSSSSDEEAPVPAKKSSGVSSGSGHSLVKKIEAFAAECSSEPLHLSSSLNSYERLLAHDCAERLGVSHVSIGEGLERHIVIGRKNSGDKKRKKSWSNNSSNKRSC